MRLHSSIAVLLQNVHRELDVLTQLEIESLTTGGWGYHYFPTYSRMLRTYDRPVQGMTARFSANPGQTLSGSKPCPNFGTKQPRYSRQAES